MDLHERTIAEDGYSTEPLAILDASAQLMLANIMGLQLLENGGRAAREAWQRSQLANLLAHAAAKSAYWRERITFAKQDFSALPIQGRADVAAQTSLEGSLAPTPDGPQLSYASTGSTGTPVRVYTIPANARYNVQRSLAQYFINGLPLSENRVQLSPALSLKAMGEPISVITKDHWAGELSRIFQNGTNRNIVHSYNDGALNALVSELLKSPVGYLNCQSRFIEMLNHFGGADLIAKLGIRAWMHTADLRNPEMASLLAGLNIPSYSVYSAGETGPIAHECRQTPGHFHVAHSNVIVEADTNLTAEYEGVKVSRLLITHLHAYATPIIRYDIGDFAQVHRTCPCGHDGTTLSNIYGRGKSFVRHPDGRLIPFYLSTRALLKAAPFDECRIRQTTLHSLTMEIGGRDHLSPEEISDLKKIVITATDPAFTVEIKTAKNLDWSANPKRLFFASSVA